MTFSFVTLRLRRFIISTAPGVYCVGPEAATASGAHLACDTLSLWPQMKDLAELGQKALHWLVAFFVPLCRR